MTKTYVPNAVIEIRRINGAGERIPVLCEVRDGQIAPGPCYTEEEWRSETSADWEYDQDRGLLWQGQPGGPYNFAEYEIRLGSDNGITDEHIKALRTEAAQAGDLAMVAICDVALAQQLAEIDDSVRSALEAKGIIPEHVNADVKARAECERVIGSPR